MSQAPKSSPASVPSQKDKNQSMVRQLFDGAFECVVPKRFEDVSAFRDIPNNQEVFADAETDQSIIIEILEHQAVADDQAAK